MMHEIGESSYGNPQEDEIEVAPLLPPDHLPLPPPVTSQPVRRKKGQRKSKAHTPKPSSRRWMKSTLYCMNVVARVLVWCTFIALSIAVIWYSYELFNHGTDPHLIAWFSAGAFVLLGFPISMWGIVSHLANYNQPHVQVYVVRILWMVPIYSIESWLAMRFHKHAIYIETLRDFYEAYVLYSFLQFLIQVLGGEEALILMLKDKSPTRGVHMWGLQWCVKPWLMGQPIRKSVVEGQSMKRIHWKSPFFVKCKFGVLQYVWSKLVLTAATMILELKGLYREGDFTIGGGYLYICILTNVSQCWALYCLIFFYYATKTELGPIRPVGKFLSVKALVFFTWWQSVTIAILYRMDMIPHYQVGQDNTWTKEDVAKGIQDYLICIEMFIAAVVHTFVFPHTEYSAKAVEARSRALNQAPLRFRKRLGRKHHPIFPDDSSSVVEMITLDSASLPSREGNSWEDAIPGHSRTNSMEEGDGFTSIPAWETAEEDLLMQPLESVPDVLEEVSERTGEANADVEASAGDDEDETEEPSEEPLPTKRTGFVRAFIDSAIPHDIIRDSTVGIVKGDYTVERKTLLQHAATSDQYDLFAPGRRKFQRKSGPL